MVFDYSKLRGRIVEKYGSASGFAEELGVLVQQISPKLTNKKSITKKDILVWSEKLEIPIDDIGAYFFTPKV